MPSINPLEQVRPSKGPAWDHGQSVNGNKKHVKCDYCRRVSKSSASRFKEHIAGWVMQPNGIKKKFTNVLQCGKAPEEAIKAVRMYMEAKIKKMEAKKKNNEKRLNMNIYKEDEDEMEAPPPSYLYKKVKGPIDTMFAPVDVEFVPNVPKGKANKQALENVHSLIADFFYENGISFNVARSDSYKRMC